MAEIPEELRYTAEHEYVKSLEEDSVYAVGITDYAQGELGDIVFVELPAAGTQLERNTVFGTVEAVKAVSDLYSPLTGEVVEVNEALDRDPALVNTDPYGAGWMLKIRATAPEEIDELLGRAEYEKLIG